MPNEKLKINVIKKLFARDCPGLHILNLILDVFFMLVSHMDSVGGTRLHSMKWSLPDARWLCSDQMDAIVKDWQETKVKAYCASFIVKERSLI